MGGGEWGVFFNWLVSIVSMCFGCSLINTLDVACKLVVYGSTGSAADSIRPIKCQSVTRLTLHFEEDAKTKQTEMHFRVVFSPMH